MADNCKHHWVFPSGTGKTASGKCKYCGETNELPNTITYSTWQNNPNKRGRPKKPKGRYVIRAPVNVVGR